ncbi:hypothetical protein ACMWP9_28545, partial [Escherichia coli]
SGNALADFVDMCRSGWRKLADSVLRTYRQYIHLLVNTFYWVSDSHCEAGKNQAHREAPDYG